MFITHCFVLIVAFILIKASEQLHKQSVKVTGWFLDQNKFIV